MVYGLTAGNTNSNSEKYNPEYSVTVVAVELDKFPTKEQCFMLREHRAATQAV